MALPGPKLAASSPAPPGRGAAWSLSDAPALLPAGEAEACWQLPGLLTEDLTSGQVVLDQLLPALDLISGMRGFMTVHGQPDQPRSARYVLKDYVSVSSEGKTHCSAVQPTRPLQGEGTRQPASLRDPGKLSEQTRRSHHGLAQFHVVL